MPPETPQDPRAQIAGQLRDQADACAVMGSPLYAHLLEQAARDAARGGIVWEVLAPHLAPARGGALALRLMAAVHRLVLTGAAPGLARHYPSVGGGNDGDAWPAFHDTLRAMAERVGSLTRLPCQTNEVGRAAALVVGFLRVAAVTGLPLRVLEIGASAGLNLRWDLFRYGGGGASWGDPGSPVDLGGLWRVAPPHADARVVVVERRGCDPSPVEPASAEGRLGLTASVWADQVARLGRLRGALELAERLPVVVEAASADAWLPGALAQPQPGVASVVYHSIVDEYLSDEVRARFHAALRAAASRATPDAPLAWLRLEPISRVRHHGVRLTLWPGGEDAALATCGAHGTDVAPV